MRIGTRGEKGLSSILPASSTTCGNLVKYFRLALYGVMAIVLAGGWAFLFLQSRAVDLAAANEAFASLRELREIEARWNDRLIGTRFASRTGADSRAAAQAMTATPFGSIHAKLEQQAFRLAQPVSGRELGELRRAFEEKSDKVARFLAAWGDFEASSKTFENERDALDLLLRERPPSPRDAIPAGLGRDLQVLGERVKAFSVQPRFGEHDAIRSLADQVLAIGVSDAAKPRVQSFVASARQNTDQRAFAEAFFEEAWFAASGPRLDSMSRAFERAFGNALDEVELYRVYLLYYSGFLLAVLAFLVWNLAASRLQIDRINRELRVANETLEARVTERTRELSDTLARLKESEAMLIQSEKMSSLGQMVAGIAHEVNTPLAYVKASLESVGGRLPASARLVEATGKLLALLSQDGADEKELSSQFALVREIVDELGGEGAKDIETAVRDGLHGIGQIGEIVRNLRDFSRLDRSRTADYDLREGVESTLRIAQHLLKARRIEKAFGDIPHVACSPSQINQVLLNLITNGAQASAEEGGTITLRTGMRGTDHVTVEVGDNGHGIPPEVLPKIFDPFFTTKEVGKGTGLGLSISYRIIESHGGKLEVQSTPGVGTRFTIVLPVKPAG